VPVARPSCFGSLSSGLCPLELAWPISSGDSRFFPHPADKPAQSGIATKHALQYLLKLAIKEGLWEEFYADQEDRHAG
jgi:hypothetical protein